MKLVLLFFCFSILNLSAKPRMVLDADTANEIDDLYAITRMLKQDKFEVLGLTSTQWFHYLSGEKTVHQSQALNEKLVRLLGRADLPLPLGADEAMGKPWGGFEPKDSPAAQFIIKAAKETPADEKLIVVCLGASTNLASAIAIAPEIAPRLDAYLLGFRYDFEKKVWNKSSFNVRRDLNAADFLLNQKDLQLSIMPANVARPLMFEKGETFEKNKALGPLGQALTDRWKEHAPPHMAKWVMWDLALVEALIHPEMAKTIRVVTPLENEKREVTLYRSIDVPKMAADYWSAVVK
ncbi:MAG: nucleoside hydrolase [Akkermansiaceae bacterium]